MKTLRSKFFLLILIPVIAVLVVLEFRNYRTASDLLIDQMDKTARNYLWASSESLSGKIGAIRTVLRLEALDENISNRTDAARRNFFIALTWKLGSSVTSVYMGYPDGRMIRGASTQLPSDYDPRQRSWYQNALQLPKGKVEGVTAPYLDAGTGIPVITLFRKVLAPDKSLVGVLGVDIDVQTAAQSMDEVYPPPIGALKLLAKSDGTILIHPDPEKVGTNIDTTRGLLGKRIAAGIRNPEVTSRQYMEKWQDTLWYAGFHRVEGTDLALVFMVPANSILKPLNRLHIEIIGLGSALVILLLALLIFMLRKITQPLLILTQSAVRVARHGSYQDPLDINSRDEVGKLTQAFNSMMEGLRQRDFIRETFGRYVTKEVVEQLLETPDGLKLGGENREVTIMLSDLRGFTPLTEHLEPDQVVNLLNRYFEKMESIITQHQGTINEFLGDAILTFFGAPVQYEDHAQKAVSCAVAMQLAMEDFNAQNDAAGLPQLSMGIGINTGSAIVGNIGSQNRAKYGVVGHTINLASRVEGTTMGGQVIITESTFEIVRSNVETRGTRTLNLKGVEQGVTIYDVKAVALPTPMRLPDETPAATLLENPISVNVHVMKNKEVDGGPKGGLLTHFSPTWACVFMSDKIETTREVRMDIRETDSEKPVGMYARIASSDREPNGNSHWVKISYVSPGAEQIVQRLSRQP
jgi:class 3 adenylate cyclase